MVQILIDVPESEKQGLIETMKGIFADAALYADECVKILVKQYRADEAAVERDVFYHSAIGRIISGKPLLEPHQRVTEVIESYWPHVLGLPKSQSIAIQANNPSPCSVCGALKWTNIKTCEECGY